VVLKRWIFLSVSVESVEKRLEKTSLSSSLLVLEVKEEEEKRLRRRRKIRMNKKDGHARSMTKSGVWRMIGIAWLALVTWIFTRSLIQVSLITLIHHAVFLIMFYLHERAWLSKPLHHRFRSSVRYGIKAITYEVILGNLILGTIAWMVTGDVTKMTRITVVYIQSKLMLYYVYDWAWDERR